MKKLLIILGVFFCFVIFTNAQIECKHAKITGVSVCTVDSNKYVAVYVSLSESGKKAVKNGGSVWCVVQVAFAGAEDYLEETVQKGDITVNGGNQFRFKCKSDEMAKLIEEVYLVDDKYLFSTDFRIRCN